MDLVILREISFEKMLFLGILYCLFCFAYHVIIILGPYFVWDFPCRNNIFPSLSAAN